MLVKPREARIEGQVRPVNLVDVYGSPGELAAMMKALGAAIEHGHGEAHWEDEEGNPYSLWIFHRAQLSVSDSPKPESATAGGGETIRTAVTTE